MLNYNSRHVFCYRISGSSDFILAHCFITFILGAHSGQ